MREPAGSPAFHGPRAMAGTRPRVLGNEAMAAKRPRTKAKKKAPKGRSKSEKVKSPARPKKAKAGSSKKAKKAPRAAAADRAYAKRSDYGASVDAFVEKLPPKKKEIVNALREIVRDAVPGVAEAIRWGMPVFARKKLICYASTKSDYVRFGFYARIELEDPDDKVSGALAYVRLNDATEIERPLLHRWIQQVVEHTGA